MSKPKPKMMTSARDKSKTINSVAPKSPINASHLNANKQKTLIDKGVNNLVLKPILDIGEKIMNNRITVSNCIKVNYRPFLNFSNFNLTFIKYFR